MGPGQLIEARVCRAKPRAQGEAEATLVSQALPFLEYDLHRQVSSIRYITLAAICVG